MTTRLYGEQDKILLRAYEAERNALVGPTAQYYVLVRGANVDPLYNEPTADPLYGGLVTGSDAKHTDAFRFDGPYSIVMAVIFERSTGRDEEVDEAGPEARFDGECEISRNEWEAKMGLTALPKEADVIFVNAEWFDVSLANTGGHVTDSEIYVGFKLMLKKRTRFTPDRKI